MWPLCSTVLALSAVPAPADFGRELAFLGGLGVGPSMAAEVVGDTLISIGRGKLHNGKMVIPNGYGGVSVER